MGYLTAQYSITVLRSVQWHGRIGVRGCLETFATYSYCPGSGVPRMKKMGENLGISRAFKWATKILKAFLKEIHYVLINSKSEQPQGLNACKNSDRKERTEICILTRCLETAIHPRVYIRMACWVLEINKVPTKCEIYSSCLNFYINCLLCLPTSLLVLHIMRHKHFILFLN